MARMLVPQTPGYKYRDTGDYPCQCCGREVKGGSRYSVELDTDNRAIDRENPERILYAGSNGFFPIGTKCAQWLKKEHREFFERYVWVG